MYKYKQIRDGWGWIGVEENVVVRLKWLEGKHCDGIYLKTSNCWKIEENFIKILHESWKVGKFEEKSKKKKRKFIQKLSFQRVFHCTATLNQTSNFFTLIFINFPSSHLRPSFLSSLKITYEKKTSYIHQQTSQQIASAVFLS